MCHRRIHEIPLSIIGTAHEPDAVVITEKDDVTLAVTTKDDSPAVIGLQP
jgi:hypothetical protein